MGARDQFFDGPVDHAPNEDHTDQPDHRYRNPHEQDQVRAVLRRLGVHGGQRQVGIDDPQHALPCGMAAHAGRRVFDGPDHAQQTFPLPGEYARPVRTVQLHQRRALGVASVTRFRPLIDHPVDLRGVGGKADAAFLVEDANTPDTRLAAQFLYDVVERLPVVAQHLIMRAALDHIGDALRRLQHHLLGVAPLVPQVEVAE